MQASHEGLRELVEELIRIGQDGEKLAVKSMSLSKSSTPLTELTKLALLKALGPIIDSRYDQQYLTFL